MVLSNRWICGIAAILMLVSVSACEKNSTRLVLNEYGPTEISAGKDFNVQPNGLSAIWATTKNATPETVLVLANEKLASVVHQDGTLVTAYVPKHLYAKPGKYPLHLLDEKSGEKSNQLQLVVK